MKSKKISFKMNLCLYFFFSTLVIVLLITSSFYLFVKEKLRSEITENLKSTVYLGANTLDTDAFKKLTKKLSSDNMSSDEVKAVHSSEEYKKISAQLNNIRDTKNGLILYAYTLVPGKDQNQARFVVDADVLEAEKNPNPDEEVSTFGKSYDISAQPVTQQALTDKINIVDTKFVYDEQYHTNSIMGFAPVYDKKTHEFLGVVGADISDKNISKFLNKALLLSLAITFTAIFAVIIVSVILAESVSKPIFKLSTIVKCFSDKDFAARASFDTHIKEISDLIDNFNIMAQTIQSYSNNLIMLNSSYERFVPVEFLNFLSKENIMQVKLGDQIQKDMAVLFSDIRSFTTLSEAMTPKQTFDFLNSYLQHVGPIIRKHTGFVDKYLGDGIMALFPRSPDDAIMAANEIRQEMIAYNKNRLDQGLIEINTGIGIHIGTVMLGTIGEDKRMQGTVISDAVNLASRLESLTKDLGVSLLISKEVFSRLEEPDNYKHRYLGNTNVKGKTESVAIFEIYSSDPPKLLALKDSTKRDFENAIYYYNNEDYSAAEELFQAVLSKWPDKISILYVGKCQDKLREMATKDGGPAKGSQAG